MSGKNVLVAYGTRYGSARIAAADIASALEKEGHRTTLVDLRKEKLPGKPGDYDMVIAGSSIAMFSWIARVKRLLRKCAKSGVPTAVYITCGTAIESVEKAREKFLDKILTRVGLKPVLTLITGPVIDFRPGEGVPEKLKKRIKGTIRAMAKDKYQENALMDMRDMDVFGAFLDDVKGFLASGEKA